MRKQKKLTREVDCGEKTGAKGAGEVVQVEGKGGMEKVGKVENKGGRPRIRVSDEAKKKIIQGVRLGIPVDRLIPIAIPSGSPGAWTNLMRLDPVFAEQIQSAKAEGELDLVLRISSSSDGWQSSAWLLERTRGYVARQQLEHSGPGGKALTIAHQVLAAVQHGERA
jgi:hypothetical protein